MPAYRMQTRCEPAPRLCLLSDSGQRSVSPGAGSVSHEQSQLALAPATDQSLTESAESASKLYSGPTRDRPLCARQVSPTTNLIKLLASEARQLRAAALARTLLEARDRNFTRALRDRARPSACHKFSAEQTFARHEALDCKTGRACRRPVDIVEAAELWAPKRAIIAREVVHNGGDGFAPARRQLLVSRRCYKL